jgi:hypothetical protein
MSDTEKKIAKIRAKVTPVKHIPRGTVETMELLFNIQFLLDELDRLRAERDSHGPEGRNYTNKQYVDLLAERDKLIEGLREIDTHIRSTPEPVQYIVGTLKRVLPEYREGVTVE